MRLATTGMRLWLQGGEHGHREAAGFLWCFTPRRNREPPPRQMSDTPQKQKVSDMSDKCPLSCRAQSRHIRLSRDVAGLPEAEFAVSDGFQTVIRLVQGGEEPSGKTSGLVLEMIRQQPEITMPEMAEALGKSPGP